MLCVFEVCDRGLCLPVVCHVVCACHFVFVCLSVFDIVSEVCGCPLVCLGFVFEVYVVCVCRFVCVCVWLVCGCV